MTLTAIDRELLDRCLARKPRSWEDFVDRFIGLVHHVVEQTGQSRSLDLSSEDREWKARSRAALARPERTPIR